MCNLSHNRLSAGFTLIEVLVASVLLFMAISLASYSYQASLKTNLSAANSVERAVAIGFIRELIDESLRVRPDQSEGEGSWGSVDFTWRVEERRQKFSESGLDIESGGQVDFGKPLVLLDIVIEINGVGYPYVYLSWR